MRPERTSAGGSEPMFIAVIITQTLPALRLFKAVEHRQQVSVKPRFLPFSKISRCRR